eukprot:RCo023875
MATARSMAAPQSGSRWECLGSDRELLEGRLSETRPLIKMHYARPREYFVARQGDIKLSSKEALECSTELRPFKDPTYDLRREEHEIGVQAVINPCDAVVQTPWYRKVERAVQVNPTVVDVFKDFVNAESELSDAQRAAIPGATAFLRKVLPVVEHSLVLNELVPIFLDDYTQLQDDESFIGQKEESFLKENQPFVHHTYTKGKRVSCIDWQPKSNRIVALSVMEPIGFEERVQLNRRVQEATVVVWSFADSIHPQFVLEAPNEVTVVRFNPTNPMILAGGCTNGQVCLWDLSKATQALKSKSKKGGHSAAAAA